MTTYIVPDSPADPEIAALELIVRLPAAILHTEGFTLGTSSDATLSTRRGRASDSVLPSGRQSDPHGGGPNHPFRV
jgi:hypothetical protein